MNFAESAKAFANQEINDNPNIGRVELIKRVRARLEEKRQRINQGRMPAERVGSLELWLFLITTGIRIIIEIWKYRRDRKARGTWGKV